MGAPFVAAQPEVEVVSRAGKRVLNPWRGTFLNAGHSVVKTENRNTLDEKKNPRQRRTETHKHLHQDLRKANDYFL